MLRNLLFRMLAFPVVIGVSSWLFPVHTGSFAHLLGIGWLLAIAGYLLDQLAVEFWDNIWWGALVSVLMVIFVLKLTPVILVGANISWPGAILTGVVAGAAEYLYRSLSGLYPAV